MRSGILASVLFMAATLCLGACAAPSEEDGADEQTSNVTGGSTSVEPPVAFLFEAASRSSTPACVGAMLGDRVAVTAKACAKQGMLVGRAADKDGRGARATVTKVHVPPGADAEIAVVELDKPLEGARALLTHMPLRPTYAVSSYAAVAGKGLFAVDKDEASSVKASILEEGASHGRLVPAKGSEICDGDVGAPVCSTTATQIAGFRIRGTCGLAGIVVGRADAPTQSATDPSATGSAPAQPPAASACSGGAWKVASLGRYADFLKRVAPQAFEPLRIDKPVLRNFPYVPEGLWGYETGGAIKSCKIESKTIASVKPGADSEKLTAKVSFASMQKRSAPWGRFGIAKKSDPTQVRWLPAGALGAKAGEAFDLSFEGVVNAAAPGDYIVMFRASADGGETWSVCDTDGLVASGAGKALSLQVSETPGSTPSPTEPPPAGQPSPQDQKPGTDYSDPPAPSGDTSTGEGEDGYDPLGDDPEGSSAVKVAPKKKSDAGGCSTTGSSPTSSGLPALGAALGLAALLRRRRR